MAKAYTQKEITKIELLLSKEEAELLADFLEENESDVVLKTIMVELKNALYK